MASTQQRNDQQRDERSGLRAGVLGRMARSMLAAGSVQPVKLWLITSPAGMVPSGIPWIAG